MMRPDDIEHAPVQKIIDPSNGRDITGEYASATAAEFRSAMKNIFFQIALRAFRGDPTSLMEEAQSRYQAYFQAMKGGTNIHPEHITRAIEGEHSRQRRLHAALSRIVSLYTRAGIKAEVISPDHCYADPYWDTGLVYGCNLRLGGSVLCAFPLVNARTDCYLSPVQDPVAASVAYVDADCILLLPHDQDLAENVLAAGAALFSGEKDVKGDFPGARAARLHNSFLFLSTEEDYSPAQLQAFKVRYGVHAVVKIAITSLIYTGEDPALTALERELGPGAPC